MYDNSELIKAKEELNRYNQLTAEKEAMEERLRQMQISEADLRLRMEKEQQEADRAAMDMGKGLFSKRRKKEIFFKELAEAEESRRAYQDAGVAYENLVERIKTAEQTLKENEDITRRYHTIFRRTLMEVKNMDLPVSARLRETGARMEELLPRINSLNRLIEEGTSLTEYYDVLDNTFVLIYVDMPHTFGDVMNRFTRWEMEFSDSFAKSRKATVDFLEKVRESAGEDTKSLSVDNLQFLFDRMEETLSDMKRKPMTDWYRPANIHTTNPEFDIVKVHPNSPICILKTESDELGNRMLGIMNEFRQCIAPLKAEYDALRKEQEELLLSEIG